MEKHIARGVSIKTILTKDKVTRNSRGRGFSLCLLHKISASMEIEFSKGNAIKLLC